MEQKTLVEGPWVRHLVGSLVLHTDLDLDVFLHEQLVDSLVDFSDDAFRPCQEYLSWDLIELFKCNVLAHDGRVEDLADYLRTCDH